jgi:hypothetical protein
MPIFNHYDAQSHHFKDGGRGWTPMAIFVTDRAVELDVPRPLPGAIGAIFLIDMAI